MDVAKTFFGVLLFLIVSSHSLAQTDSSKLSTIYFLRWTGDPGSIEAFNTFIDSSLACRINNKRYSIHTVPSGLHRLQVRFDGRSPRKRISTLDIDMEPGKTYYINVEIRHLSFGYDISLTEVTYNSAKRWLPFLKEDLKCK